MDGVIYSTKQECLKAIETLKAVGMEPQPWMLEQLQAYENAEKTTDTPIWNTLQANYPYGIMPAEKKKCVESTVSQLLEEGEHAEEPGLLLGKIQCGKTDTFEDIIGLSFDRGVDVAIVITKGTRALVSQTIMRMKKDYQWFKASDDLRQRATINIYDIMDIGRAGLKQAKVENSKTVIVCKKQAKNMERLIELFEKKSPFLKKKKVIIVDDEADFASRNYMSVKGKAQTNENGATAAQTSEMKMAKISQQIDDFRSIPQFCRYLQVTATPYCLYLQPMGELNLNGNVVKPFKPRFTNLVPTHAAYIGGQQYFVESKDARSMYSHLYHKVDQKCIDVLGHEDKRYLNNAVSSGNIYDLTTALVAYFMATAIRRIQARQDEKDYKTSAIFHVDIDKRSHNWQKRVIERLIESIKSAIVDEDHSDERIWRAKENAYQDFLLSNEKGRNEGLISVELPSEEEILAEMRDIFSPKMNKYSIQTVNSDEEVSSLLNEETGELNLECAANIFIGGNILDRGVTIKNMLCFFYGRDPKRFQQDTVLQHARMYGARSKEDMAVMRLHTTESIYKILQRMNELDEQLRQWFVDGEDHMEPNAVFVGYDSNIKPCAPQKIKVSNALVLKPQKRILPVGFWTGSKTATKKTVEQIRKLITSVPGYSQQDEDGFFEMDKMTAFEIIRLIESTYVYNDKDKLHNMDHKNDIKEMLCALEYCTQKSRGKIWALHREGREMSRVRQNGGFVDAPDDGRTDTKPSRDKATDAPVIMFLQENGDVIKDENGENIGWNGAPFYWPVLMTQKNIAPVMYALDQKAKGKASCTEIDNILGDIDRKDVLSLTFKGDLVEHFGKEGEEYKYEDEENELPWETRVLRQTSAGRYLMKDEKGEWMLNPEVEIDKAHYHGLYSLNNAKFPFVVRPFKYMCLRNGHNANADVMLMELFEPEKWDIHPVDNCINEDGDLIDRDSKQVLMHTTDTIYDKNMNQTSFIDDTVTQWEIDYPIKRIIKVKKYSTCDDEVFNNEETNPQE